MFRPQLYSLVFPCNVFIFVVGAFWSDYIAVRQLNPKELLYSSWLKYSSRAGAAILFSIRRTQEEGHLKYSDDFYPLTIYFTIKCWGCAVKIVIRNVGEQLQRSPWHFEDITRYTTSRTSASARGGKLEGVRGWISRHGKKKHPRESWEKWWR